MPHRVVMPSVNHNTGRYANNRAEVSHRRPDSASDICENSSLLTSSTILLGSRIIQNLFRMARHLLRPLNPTATRSRFPYLA